VPPVSSLAARARQAADIRPWLRAHAIELVALTGVIVIAALMRLIKLGTIPQIVGGDEASTIEDALRIRAGTGPGTIGFDWSGSPILATYPLAWIMRVFGDSVSDVRLYVVIFSMLTILFLYVLAREAMGVLPALAATLLLASNVWFLNFSRTLWYNMNAPFFAVVACWTMIRALKTESTRAAFAWWTLTGCLVAASLYGYSTGRFIAISITVVVIIGVVTRVTSARRAIAGLVLAGAISAVLFAPMARYILEDDHRDKFTQRADTVSVFNRRNADGSKMNGWAIAWDNIEPNYRGLIFNEGQQAQRGPYNARYHPPYRAALEIVGTHLFLAGLVIGAFRWRRTYYWYPFFIPAAIANVFSGDTPDYSRALPLAPFYFLFIGLTFDEAMRYEWRFAERWRVVRRWRWAPRAAVAAAVVAVTAFIAVRDVNLYFDWQDELGTQTVRMPGLDYCEYEGWLAIAKEAAAVGALADPTRFDAEVRRELRCSDVVAEQGGYD
jgi:4-amino-4-deoxy-L-arabinose transferase-like glycosyltransferase